MTEEGAPLRRFPESLDMQLLLATEIAPLPPQSLLPEVDWQVPYRLELSTELQEAP